MKKWVTSEANGMVSVRCCIWSGEVNAYALLMVNSTYYGWITQVIILCDGSCHPCSWPLLGKLVSKLEDPWILLQHLGNFHLYSCSQLLPLVAGADTCAGWPRRKRKQLTCTGKRQGYLLDKKAKRQRSQIKRYRVTWDVFSHNHLNPVPCLEAKSNRQLSSLVSYSWKN